MMVVLTFYTTYCEQGIFLEAVDIDPTGNGGEKKMIQNVCTHITSKRIELESPGWSGLVRS